VQNNNKRKSHTQSEICNDFLIFEANNPLDLGFAFGIETRDSDTDFDSDGLIMLFHSRISVENRLCIYTHIPPRSENWSSGLSIMTVTAMST